MPRTIIVEDEPLARRKLAAFVERVEELTLVGTFATAEEALDYLRSHRVDLLFLDIRIEGGMSGLQLLDRLTERPRVVMTTAYEEYALRGFELGVVDYLLKPFSFERFRTSVDRALRDLSLDAPASPETPKAETSKPATTEPEAKSDERYLLVKSEYRLERIALSEIRYVEGMKDYLRIHTADRKVMTLMSFAALAAELPEAEFVRIHKSYMVALAHVTAASRDTLTIDGAVSLPIGRAYKEQVMTRIKNR
jgi:DNA-binding LytR/AlgR family response regulator